MHVIHLAPEFPASQRRFVRGLKNVGARVTGIGDRRPEHLDSEVRGLLDGYVYVPNVTNSSQVTDAVRKIQRAGPWVHRLEATIEAHMYAAAIARENCGIPGMSFEAVELCRDKVKMKAHLREHGIASALNAPVSNAAEARAFAKKVGFPLILKPRDGAGASKTYKIDNAAELEAALQETGLTRRELGYTMEEFITGHEGFWDTLTINGRVVWEFISHYYPNVLPAMRNPNTHAMIVATNRVNVDSYGELKQFGRKVVDALGITTSATHMEWFYGPKGLRFSEIGARPPGVNYWDVYAAANDLDMYTEWARAICWGDVRAMPSRNYAAGLLSIRPSSQGTVRGYTGVEEMQRKYGRNIIKAYLPPEGSRTQSHEGGYLANAWIVARHPDYDGCRAMLDDIGRNLRMWAG